MYEFLRDLTDFTEANEKKAGFCSVSSMPASERTDVSLDIYNDEKIMRSFKVLRYKLKESSKYIACLKAENLTKDIYIARLMQSETDLLYTNQQLKEKTSHQSYSLYYFKKKLILSKESLKDFRSLYYQLLFYQTSAADFKTQLYQLHKEKSKILYLTTSYKLILEYSIAKLYLYRCSYSSYMNELYCALEAEKERLYKTYNQLRILQIRFDYEVFSRYWTSSNYEQIECKEQLKYVKEEVLSIQQRLEKEKQRRTEIEEYVLELEEGFGLWKVKAYTFYKYSVGLKKKIHKKQQKVYNSKKQTYKVNNERIVWQYKCEKCFGLAEYLIGRVKRELTGDVVYLARSCEYKLTKLKEERMVHPSSEARKSKPHHQRYSSHFKLLLHPRTLHEDSPLPLYTHSHSNINHSYSKANQFINKYGLNYKENYQPSTLTATQHETQNGNCTLNFKFNSNTENTGFRNTAYGKRNNITDSQLTFGRHHVRDIEDKTLEARILKERQYMEKQLKYKMLFRRIDVAPSPYRKRLRSEYLKQNTNKIENEC